MRFGLNQKTVANLPFEAFLDLATDLGMFGVEPRNDLGRPMFDGISPARAGQMARDRGLVLLGLSQVFPFNHWTEEREAAIRALIEMAAESGARGLSLIPSVEPARPVLSIEQALERILVLLEGTGVTALVEPIGFTTSSLRTKAELVDAITALGASDRVKVVHDTFQHSLSGERSLFHAHTATVHISGISDAKAVLDDALDSRRGLVDASDRIDTVGQISAFLALDFEGAFSFEATHPSVINTDDPAPMLRRSLRYLENAVAQGETEVQISGRRPSAAIKSVPQAR